MDKDWYRLNFPMNLQYFAEGAGGEKTENATAKRLKDAREEGQVAKSQELITAVMLFALFIALKVFGTYLGNGFSKAFLKNYRYISTYGIEIATVGNVSAMLREVIFDVILLCLPIFAFAIVVAFLLNVLQVRWVVTAKPLKPKFNRLNPVSGFKKIFSKDKIFELIKSIAKIVLIFYMAYDTIKDEVDKIKILYDLGLWQAVLYICDFVIDMGIKISAVYLILGLADLIYNRIKFKNDMKMTKQEVKDEYKQQEGDPQVKGRIKSKMREASMQRMMQKMPEADVVITNPTHFACAIKYDKEQAAAPVLIAKGADHLAQKIKDVAREFQVPIVENKPLARMLYYNVDLDAEIPQELYQMTAEVLAYVYQLKNK
ncbi:MAG: flagellar biosynthesis protein FlhB [Lachnospiraceae bacterium]|nr:flagellar biosynthesis protein FlhB [Lachnospiraceae bacterium]